jgi:predicted transcriptional regulator
MMDIRCVVFVRGKTPSEEIINLAVENHMAVLSTHYRMYNACGILYSNGLRGGEDNE